MERHPDLDGLVVASDLMAAGALRVLAEMGRRVPDDIAVVGYDDLGVAERTTPPLTTVRQPVDEMAERATRLLLERVDGVDGSHPDPADHPADPRAPRRARETPQASDDDQLLDPPPDLVADRPDGLDALARRVVERPVLVARAGVERAGVAAAHRDHHVGRLDGVVG